MIEFKELLEQDSQTEHEFPDEKLVSTLRLTSLSHSLREEGNSEEFKDQNNWLFSADDPNGSIPTINFDILKDLCLSDGLKSCDAFFYDFHGNSKSLLLEFKNCNKSELVSKFLNGSDDGILLKIRDSKNILTAQIKFDGKYSNDDLVSNTHIIIVYGGKNNVVSKSIVPSAVSKYKRSERGKPNKPTALSFNKQKSENNDRFGIKIKDFGFSQCLKEDFPVPGEPDFRKEKSSGKIRNYTLFSSFDFKGLIEKGFFNNWDWGEYAAYMGAE